MGKGLASLILILLLLTSDGPSLMTAAPVVSSETSWLRIRKNLSGSPDVISGYPDMAMSEDGTTVAVVWSEGYSGSAGAKHHGRIYLRWNSENTGTWSSKITIDDGANASSDWARDAAVALHGTTAHVVWVRVRDNNKYSVWYGSCELDVANPHNDACASTTGPSELESETSNEITSPDIAVDGSGNVFAVWVRSDVGIRYREYTSSSWQTVETLSTGSEDKSRPTVGVGGGTVYAVWIRLYQDVPQPLRYDVRSRQKDVGETSWDAIQGVYDAGVDNPSRYPAVVVGGSPPTAYAMWERFDDGEGDFRIPYKFFNQDNIYWQPAGASAWNGVPDKSNDALYDAAESGSSEVIYVHYLRPALALADSGRLHAVWHHHLLLGEGDDIYRVMYSYSDNPTATTPTWSEPVVFAELSGDEDLTAEERQFSVDNVAPRIAVGGTQDKPHIHIVLMLQSGDGWDVWYLSNELYKTTSLPTVMRNY